MQTAVVAYNRNNTQQSQQANYVYFLFVNIKFEFRQVIALMIQIAKKPYIKAYKFPYLSVTAAFFFGFYALALVLPFFMVFSVRNFYLSFADTFSTSASIQFSYQYYLQIQTSQSVHTYSNIFTTAASQAITVSYLYSNSSQVHKFQVTWPKSADERVINVKMLLFFNYSTDNISEAIGFVDNSQTGFSLSDVAFTDSVRVAAGENLNALPPTSEILSANDYNVGITKIKLQRDYQLYLASNPQKASTNMLTNVLNIDYWVRDSDFVSSQEYPTVLGQFIWSFSQYFPIAFVSWLIATSVLRLMFRENILRRVVIPDTISKP